MSGNDILLIMILWPFAGSLAVYLAGRTSEKATDFAALITGFIELVLLIIAVLLSCSNPELTTLSVPYVEGFGLNFRFDGFRIVYTCVTVFMWVCSIAISAEYFGEGSTLVRYYVFCLWTFAATIGVFISADLITTFTFFEIMSLASYAFVAHTEKKEAMRAAETYLAVAVIGGLVMLMGMFILYDEVGTLTIGELHDACSAALTNGRPTSKMYTAGALILFGFGAKAGMFPLHIWLPKAHPVAPAPASALLSGVLTKSGIYGILILCIEIFAQDFAFGFAVVLLGVVTMFTGALLAVFSIDLKRTLACSSVSQIGFILVGIGLVPLLGEECTLAMSGAMLYMVNHSMFKLTLFLCAAAVYMKCHMLDLNDIRGYGRDMPLLKALFIIGALGISGVPLLSGYVSKTLIHEGIVEYMHMAGNLHWLFKTIEIIFLVSGGMTFSYMMKLFHAIFVDLPEENCKYASEHFPSKKISLISYAAIIIPASVIAFFGICPNIFIRKLAVLMGRFNTFVYNTEQLEILDNIKIFSFENLKGSLISLGLGSVFFILIRLFLTEGDRRKAPHYINRWPAKLDLEELVYRPLLCRFFPFLFNTVGRFIATDLIKGSWKAIMCVRFPAGFFASDFVKGIWRGINAFGSCFARVLSDLFNNFIEFLKATVFSELKPKSEKRKRIIRRNFERAEGYYKVVSSGISFGLLMICLGLCITLFYLLFLLFS